MRIGDVHKLAGGLNIEGGFPARDLLKTSPNAKWINLILVLDRPLIDNIIFDDIFANNPYPLLENALDNLNENHFLAAYVMILMYYIENGRKLFNISDNQVYRIMVHIHQDEKSVPLVDLIDSYIKQIYSDTISHDMNITISYCTDDKNYLNSGHDYAGTDLLISLSQCAGLDSMFEPGSLLIADKFIPYDIDNKIIMTNNYYQEPNILLLHLNDILNSKYHEYAINFVNQNHQSANPLKKHQAEKFSTQSFHITNILQVNKLWNPKDENEMVNIDYF